MPAGCPPGGRLFRECAGEYGVLLEDPCAPLGSDAACRKRKRHNVAIILDAIRA
jgi:hypothetical protein